MLFFSTMVGEVKSNVQAGKYLEAAGFFCVWVLLPILVAGCGGGLAWLLYSMLKHAFSYGVFYGSGAVVLLVVSFGAALTIGKVGGEGLGNWMGEKLSEGNDNPPNRAEGAADEKF